MPDDKTSVDSFEIVRDLVQEQLKTVVNEPFDPNESKPHSLVKNFNSACMNKSIIETRGIKPLVDILETFGGWPAVKGDTWSENNWDWIENIKKFRQMGLGTSMILSFSIATDWKNSSMRILEVYFTYFRSYYK